MDDLARKISERMETDLLTVFGVPRKWPQTALAFRGGTFVTLQLDDTGNVIEPCSMCGPVLLCSKHMALIT